MRTSVNLSLCAAVVASILVDPRSAFAQKTYRVTIDSKPDGASVWIGERDGDPDGKTPYDTRLPEGKHTVFIERDGYDILVQEITVKERRKGKQRFNYELVELSYGTIDVLAADGQEAADGAKVLIDGEERGTVPDSFQTAEGPHQVEVIKDGFKRFESWIEVEKGESVEISVTLEAKGDGDGDGSGDGGGSGDMGGGGDLIGGGDKKKGTSGTLVRFDAGMGAGLRHFDYDQPATNNLRPYAANGIALLNIRAEFYAGRLASALKYFSLFGGVSLSLPSESNTKNGDEAIGTSWFRHEVGLRTRLAAGPGYFGIDLAEGGNSFTFTNAGLLADEIPDVRYMYARGGVWYGTESPVMSVGGGADGLFVFMNEGVSERFTNPSVFGVRGHAWFRRRLVASLQASVSASFTYFAHSFEPGPAHSATGGYDLMADFIIAAGYSF